MRVDSKAIPSFNYRLIFFYAQTLVWVQFLNLQLLLNCNFKTCYMVEYVWIEYILGTYVVGSYVIAYRPYIINQYVMCVTLRVERFWPVRYVWCILDAYVLFKVHNRWQPYYLVVVKNIEAQQNH